MSVQDEEYFENEYYIYNIRFFKLIGILLYETSSRKMTHICFFNFTIAIALLTQLIVLSIYMLFISKLKVNPITKLLETALPSLFCYFNLLSKVTIMKKLLFRLKTDWNNMRNKFELMILRRYTNQSRLCTIVIAITFYLYIATLFLPSMARGILYIFDETHFYFALFHEYASLVIHPIWKIEEGYKSNSYNFYNTCGSVRFIEEFKLIIGIIKYYDNVVEFITTEIYTKLCQIPF
ncbi:odorant receptor 46a-like isoform X1 [Vespula maculifrons]|uniref:Odorant receptor 46a-like isoform X1 n=1 Tax=Vespula maculifrons TaxID=7453 RepID=A0ABD2BR28_VESMC